MGIKENPQTTKLKNQILSSLQSGGKSAWDIWVEMGRPDKPNYHDIYYVFSRLLEKRLVYFKLEAGIKGTKRVWFLKQGERR